MSKNCKIEIEQAKSSKNEDIQDFSDLEIDSAILESEVIHFYKIDIMIFWINRNQNFKKSIKIKVIQTISIMMILYRTVIWSQNQSNKYNITYIIIYRPESKLSSQKDNLEEIPDSMLEDLIDSDTGNLKIMISFVKAIKQNIFKKVLVNLLKQKST